MTCAHVVDVALKKVAGVKSVEVSLNRRLATVKLEPDNAVSVPQLWEVIRKNGYTPKSTMVAIRGTLGSGNGQLELKVSGSNKILTLVPNLQDLGAYRDAPGKLGKAVVVRGVMEPGKDLNVAVPLRLTKIE